MKHDFGLDDTIVAVATAAGPGGIGVVRLSGPLATRIAAPNFSAKSGQPLEAFASHTVHYGWVHDHGVPVDEALVTVMRAPRTFTRQDVVEISCHGGPVSVRAVLDLMLAGGARLAGPGEFTKRAFLNGRIDLTRAEAVLDVIESRTRAFLRVSARQLQGALAIELERARGDLLGVYTEIEAILNFPEDDRAPDTSSLAAATRDVRARLGRLLATGDQGQILRDGVRVVLCGKPNVGKSSLLNGLLRAPRAIVSDIAGTTRDTIEETASLGDVPVRLVDTAGIIAPRDTIEEEAVRRSHAHMAAADVALLVIDGSRPLDSEDVRVRDQLEDGRTVLVVINKGDLPSRVDDDAARDFAGARPLIRISAWRAEDLDRLRELILRHVLPDSPTENSGILLTNVRHIDALRRCARELDSALEGFDRGAALEMISEDIKRAVCELDRITGRDIDLDLIDRIFSDFCVGK